MYHMLSSLAITQLVGMGLNALPQLGTCLATSYHILSGLTITQLADKYFSTPSSYTSNSPIS
jgi:hypothetical protein